MVNSTSTQKATDHRQGQRSIFAECSSSGELEKLCLEIEEAGSAKVVRNTAVELVDPLM